MIDIKLIRIVAGIEAKIFARSWIFRFFVVFTSIILGIGNVWMFSHTNSNWMLRCISSSPAYFNILLLTLIQSLIVPFGAVESLRREIKLDIYESIHVRSFKNVNHILGKALGIMTPFLIVNALVLAGALVYNVVFADDVPVVWQAYILYPLVLSIPSLFFITSLSFFVASIFRNQAISLVLVIGYYLFSFAYGTGYAGRLIDFTAFHIPMLYSDFVGVENIREILVHRLFYLSLGIGFLATSCLMFKRLIQSEVSKHVTMITVVLSMVFSLGFAYIFMLDFNHGIDIRKQMNELNNKYVGYSRAKVIRYSLEIDHTGRGLDIDAELTLSNPTEKPLDMLILTLNPGFKIESVTSEGTELQFERETQIIKVIPSSSIIPGQDFNITVYYSGTVDNNACYIDIDEDYRSVINRLFAFAVDKRYGFVTPDYVLLTPECSWYPVSGIPFGLVFPDAQWKDYAEFEVRVTTSKGLTVISQADVKDIEDGNFSFTTDEKLPGLSLVIGEYEKKSVEVDGVEFAIYVRPGHDYYSPYFSDAKNIVKEVILNEKLDYEYERGMKYPFKRFMLVESPVQFMAYQRPWRTHTELVQPQMAIIPEKGAFIKGSNIRNRYEAQISGRNGPFTPNTGEVEAVTRDIIWTYIFFNMLSDNDALNTFKYSQQAYKTLNTMPIYRLFNNISTNYIPSYTLSAQFYPFIMSIESKEYPSLDYIMAFYRKHGLSINQQPTRDALLPEEIFCLELDNRSFNEILNDDSMLDKIDTVLTLKANQLFSSFSSYTNEDDLNTFLSDYINNNKFNSYSYVNFVENMNISLGHDFSDEFNSWNNERRLPEFVISEPTVTEIIVNNRPVYQTFFKIDNISDVKGSVWFEIEESLVDQIYHKQIISLESHQSKEVSFLTNQAPRLMHFNTIYSKNLPILYRVALRNKLQKDHDAEPFNGERIVEYIIPHIDPNTIIIDNLDPGFEIINEPTEKFDKTTVTFNFQIGMYPEGFVRLLTELKTPFWAKSVFTKGYGPKHSAYYTSAGNGDGRVAWTVQIERAGFYDLEYYFHDTKSIISSGVNNRRNFNDPLYDMPLIGEYNFTISHSGKSDEIVFTPPPTGSWQRLDSFNFDQGDVTIELSNKSTGLLIYADAVRWVKRK